MITPNCVAIIAYDNKKDDIIYLAKKYCSILSRYRLIATSATGERIQKATGLVVEQLASGLKGGELQIAARIVSGEVIGVVCLVDPIEVRFNEPDHQALLRVCNLYNVPLATNLATAELAIQGVAKQRDAYLIFNPVAGQGNPDKDLALIRQILEPQVSLHTIFTQPGIDPADQAREVIETIRAAESGNDTGFIIASGGDGTVSAIAGATIETGIPLGVIPRGTANAFAVAMGLPTNLKGACETIAAGNTRMVDASYCNNIPMILLAGVGFEAGMVDKANRELKNQLGRLAYVLSGAQQVFDQEPFKAEVEIEGKVLEVQARAVTVANAAPSGSVMAQGFGEVIPNDGLLEVTILIPKTFLQVVDTFATLLTSTLVKSQFEQENLICLRAEKVKITTNPPQKLVIDGEIFAANPIEFRCVPQGITIFSPLLTI